MRNTAWLFKMANNSCRQPSTTWMPRRRLEQVRAARRGLPLPRHVRSWQKTQGADSLLPPALPLRRKPHAALGSPRKPPAPRNPACAAKSRRLQRCRHSREPRGTGTRRRNHTTPQTLHRHRRSAGAAPPVLPCGKTQTPSGPDFFPAPGAHPHLLRDPRGPPKMRG